MALQTAKRPGGLGLPRRRPPGTRGPAAPLLPAPARELRIGRILPVPLSIWVPRAPARDGTTNRTNASPDMGQQLKSSQIEAGESEQRIQFFNLFIYSRTN